MAELMPARRNLMQHRYCIVPAGMPGQGNLFVGDICADAGELS